MTDEYFMMLALKEARIAYEEDEVPIGAVVVLNDRVIARGHNMNRFSAAPMWLKCTFHKIIFLFAGYWFLAALSLLNRPACGNWQPVTCD